jgi:LacI family transcriptional regulator
MIATESFSRKTATKMTLEEIARLAGFSRSTVSRVINDDPNVNAETRERVWRVIKAHDFHPNPAARTLAGRRSQVIGLMIPQALTTIFTDPYFPMLIQGSVAACDARGYFLMLSLALGQPDDTFRWLLRSRHIDGVIVVAALAGDAFVARLLDEHFPFVLVGRNSERGVLITLDTDNAHGAGMAARHLAQLDYVRIATISGPANTPAAIDRREGFLCTLRSVGIETPTEYIQAGDWSESSGKQAMQRLLQVTPPPEAVFVASDSMAIGALKALRAAGLKVPEDIALVGFDDMPLAAAVEPPLTTVRQPIDQLGFLAASTLIDLLETAPIETEGNGARHIVLPTELVVRASCGHALRRAAGAHAPAQHYC